MERSRKKDIDNDTERKYRKSQEPINKTHTKIKAKKIWATTFAIVKLKER